MNILIKSNIKVVAGSKLSRLLSRYPEVAKMMLEVKHKMQGNYYTLSSKQIALLVEKYSPMVNRDFVRQRSLSYEFASVQINKKYVNEATLALLDDILI